MALSNINTIVVAIMENRSFDHMMGYLSINETLAVEGLRNDPAWMATWENEYKGRYFPLFEIDPKLPPCLDPWHDHKSIALQISKPAVGRPNMGGFVESFATLSNPRPTDPSGVMGYFGPASVPTYHFFAKHYCVCDHWFASLPLGTQANRFMAMAGESPLVDNAGALLPDRQLVYDWLTTKNIPWRAYQWGSSFPFFTLMPRWAPQIASDLTLDQLGFGMRFRRYTRLEKDWQSSEPAPGVIFVEPEYTDGFPVDPPNDDHAPSGIQKGQQFLADLYRILTSNPEKWAHTLLVVTYDEHGGFFDHVSPLPAPTIIQGTKIDTTGVRVPAFLISPYVKPGVPFTGPLDHTSILQLIADKFTDMKDGYSLAVTDRHAMLNLNRIYQCLSDKPSDMPTSTIKHSEVATAARAAPLVQGPETPNEAAYRLAVEKLNREHPEFMKAKGWEKVSARLTATPNIA
jgi:phospholipase C